MIKINNTAFFVSDNNRYKTQTVKTQIVLGISSRKNGYHITRLLHKEYGKTKKWNTFTVTREGIIYQHFDTKYHTDYLGIKEGDKKSISIVMENMGCLFQTPTGKLINWLNEECEKENVVKKKWLGYSYWEKFPEKQIKSTLELCKHICDLYNISKEMIEFHQYHKDIVKYNGIVFKSNYIEDSNDVNPQFNIQEFSEMLKK